MKLLKCPKLWSAIALAASLGCVLTVVWCMLSVQNGSMGFRDANGIVRQAVEIGAGVAVFSALVLVYAFLKGGLISRILSGAATLLVAALVFVAVSSPPSEYDNPPGPPLNDISTDTLDPPLFDAVAAVRPENSNTLEYPGASAVERQADAFPDIAPINTDLSASEAFARSLELVRGYGWELIAESSDSGIIEAVATTPFFGFQDDVVIRVRSAGAGSVVDIRSHSRLGRGDQGKNAKRVRAFIADF